MSKTTFFELDGKQFKVELVEAKKELSHEQKQFIINLPAWTNIEFLKQYGNFYNGIERLRLEGQWQSYLISEARKRGFISGCTIKTATDMDKMKSGRLQLIGLSKLATDGRKSIVIYDNGRWVAESISEVKKHFWTNNSMLSMKNWERFNSLSDEDMEKVKCEPEKQNAEDLKLIIGYLTRQINEEKLWHILTLKQAKIIREILNDYLHN